MIAKKPEIAGPADGRIFAFGNRVFVDLSGGDSSKESLEFLLIEARVLETESGCLQILQFELQEIVIPFGPADGFIHHQAKGFDLSVGPFIAEDDWNAIKP